MSGTTPKGLRYPSGDDVPNVAQYIQNLATDVDGKFDSYVTTTTLNGAVVSTPPLAGGWQNYRTVNGGGFQLLQIFRLGNLRIVGGVISNNVSYSAPSTFLTLPSQDWPAHDVMGVGISPGMALRVDVDAAGSCAVTPWGTVAANSYHGFQIAYNINNS